MNRTIDYLLNEIAEARAVAPAAGVSIEVRGPLRASLAFAETAEAAAVELSGIATMPDGAEPTSPDVAAARLHRLLAGHADPARVSDADLWEVARAVVDSAAPPSGDVACAALQGAAGEGIVVAGAHHAWSVWIYENGDLPLPSRASAG